MNRERKGIFQRDAVVPVSIHQARDVYDMVRNHDPTNPIYEVFHVDGEMVEKYLHTVEELENTFQKTRSDIVFSIGPFKIYVCKMHS
jgi:hypothetical protein